MITVESNTHPLLVVYANGNTYVNTNIKDVHNDGTVYQYNQKCLLGTVDKGDVTTAIIQSYEALIQQASLRVTGALRAKILGVSIDYDEALLLDAEATCNTLYEELQDALSNLDVLTKEL